MIDPNYKIDRRELKYKEPESNVAWLAQQPLYKINGLALANAYMADQRKPKND